VLDAFKASMGMIWLKAVSKLLLTLNNGVAGLFKMLT
jgi:hypothetical protein